MKYPHIGKSTVSGRVVLFASPSTGVVVSGSYLALGIGKLETSIDETYFKNITLEYLSNTWGVVESKEHAEFIVELAELHGFELSCMSNKTGKFFAFDSGSIVFIDLESIAKSGCKQITIPLPPKSVKSEWPQVGNEVEVRHDSGQVLKGELLAITSEYAIIQQLGHEQHLYLSAWKFSKPKTPEEELRDELMLMATQAMRNSDFDTDHNCYYLISGLMKKYNITKKDKGDE